MSECGFWDKNTADLWIDQAKLNLLLNLWLRDVLDRSTSLTTLMDELSDKAERRGLTADKLSDMLDAR
jgi:hypothetical protein